MLHSPTTPAALIGAAHFSISLTTNFCKYSGERRSPDYLQKFVESEIAKWASPIKALGVTAE